MTDDLVKRARHNALSDMPHYASVELIEALADRIEELEASLQDARRVGAEWFEQSKQNHKRATTAEAKLARAVEGLTEIERLYHTKEKGAAWCAIHMHLVAKRILAELTGGKDE